MIGIFDLLLLWIDFAWIYVLKGDSDAVAAVRLSGSIIMLVESALIAIVSSILVYISQALGANLMDEARRGVRGVFSFVIYGGILVTLLGQILLPFIVNIYGVNIKNSEYLSDYLGVLFWGYLFMSLNNFLLLVPRYFQKIKVIYQGLSLTAVVNVITTPLFIVLFESLGYPFIYGAAIGTVIANASCSIFMIWKIFLKDFLNIGLSKLYISLKLDYRLFSERKSYILSQIFNNLTFNVSSFMYMLILSYYPSEAFNVYVVASYVFIFFGIPAQNFTASLIPVVGTYIGGNQFSEIKDMVKKMFFILLAYGLVISIIIMISHSPISHLLATYPGQSSLISEYLLFNAIPWDSKGSMTLTIINMYVIVVVGLLVLPKLFGNVTTGVFFAMGVIQTLTFITSGSYYLLGR